MLSIIVPVHNEAKTLEKNISSLERALSRADFLGSRGRTEPYEIIIAEDGSTDGTADIAKKLESVSKKGPSTIRVIATTNRIGRGKSLANAIASAKGDIIIYMDADLSTDLTHIPTIINEIRSGKDISTGSRLLPDSLVVGRSALRDFASKGYNLLIRMLFGSKIHDHQCGFKAFNRQTILPLLSQARDNHWFWDTEILILAQRNGLKVSEVPVRWKDRAESTVRLRSDIIYMGLAALSLRLRLWLRK
jgi:glycosyltransferase involved in cell wall biosynthesis